MAKFIADNAIATSDWYDLVTGYEIVFGSLWVHTKIHADGDAKAAASPICGAYSLYTLDHPDVTVVMVRASDGQQIAKCGPGV